MAGIPLFLATSAFAFELTVRVGLAPGLQSHPCAVRVRLLGQDHDLDMRFASPDLLTGIVRSDPALYGYFVVRCEGAVEPATGVVTFRDVEKDTVDFALVPNSDGVPRVVRAIQGTRAGTRPRRPLLWKVGAVVWGLGMLLLAAFLRRRVGP